LSFVATLALVAVRLEEHNGYRLDSPGKMDLRRG
jgi:hypothetical protein